MLRIIEKKWIASINGYKSNCWKLTSSAVGLVFELSNILCPIYRRTKLIVFVSLSSFGFISMTKGEPEKTLNPPGETKDASPHCVPAQGRRRLYTLDLFWNFIKIIKKFFESFTKLNYYYISTSLGGVSYKKHSEHQPQAHQLKTYFRINHIEFCRKSLCSFLTSFLLCEVWQGTEDPISLFECAISLTWSLSFAVWNMLKFLSIVFIYLLKSTI